MTVFPFFKKITCISALLAVAALLPAGQAMAGHTGEHSQRYVPGIWVDPHGCDHWIIDDGIEGYLSQRLDRYGKPVCSGVGTPNTTVGHFKTSTIGDPI